MASQNHGHITKAGQRALNQQENGIRPLDKFTLCFRYAT
jgi:hypothetical protein